ncbi:MAG: helix-turn-helix transcriptional regulator [Bacteroidetes bacterium]|nr:helix-turn-helix transcriptional regulator [Bacteroidota bacterium]
MFNKDELLKRPNYLLTTYQNEIYRKLVTYMTANNLSQKDVAEKLGVSNAYVSQIINGNFNFTLKKLIELGLMIGKVPALEFVEFEEYWKREQRGTVVSPTVSVTINVNVQILPVQYVHVVHLHKPDFKSNPFITGMKNNINISEIGNCPN